MRFPSIILYSNLPYHIHSCADHATTRLRNQISFSSVLIHRAQNGISPTLPSLFELAKRSDDLIVSSPLLSFHTFAKATDAPLTHFVEFNSKPSHGDVETFDLTRSRRHPVAVVCRDASAKTGFSR